MPIEPLPGGLFLHTSKEHKFGTDAFILSDFARVKPGEIACDLGSGCGIIPALWFRKPETAPKYAYAVELQKQPYLQMCQSLREGGLPQERFIPIHGDLRALTLPKGHFQVVTCNPPYKAAGRGILSDLDGERAARHEVTCTLEDVCACAENLLQYQGRLCICQRPERLPDAMEAMRRHRIEPKRLRFVQQRAQKAPWLFLLEGRRGAKPFLQVEAPLIVEGTDGFSDELLAIYQKTGANTP